MGLCVSPEVEGGKPTDLGEVKNQESGRNGTP